MKQNVLLLGCILHPEIVAGLDAGRRAARGSGDSPLHPEIVVKRWVLVPECGDESLVVSRVLLGRLAGAWAERRSQAPVGEVWIGGMPPEPCPGLTQSDKHYLSSRMTSKGNTQGGFFVTRGVATRRRVRACRGLRRGSECTPPHSTPAGDGGRILAGDEPGQGGAFSGSIFLGMRPKKMCRRHPVGSPRSSSRRRPLRRFGTCRDNEAVPGGREGQGSEHDHPASSHCVESAGCWFACAWTAARPLAGGFDSRRERPSPRREGKLRRGVQRTDGSG